MRIASIALAALLLVAGLMLAWVLATASGARAVLAIARHWFPPDLIISDVSGSIAGTLRVTGFRYRDPAIGMDLQIDRADLEVAPFALLARRLKVHDADMDGVLLRFFEPSGAAMTRTKPKHDPWAAPLDMVIEEMQLTRGAWHPVGAEPVVIHEARLSGSWIGPRIEARHVEFTSPQGEVSLSARLGPQAPRLQHLQAQFDWRAGEHDWRGKLDARGADEALQVAGELESPVSTALTSRLTRGAQPETWRAHVSLERFRTHPLFSTDAFETLALELDAEGNLRDLGVQGVILLDEDRIDIERLLLARRDELMKIDALRLRLNAQPAALTGSAEFTLDGSRPASAQLAWEEFALPEAWAGAGFRCSGEAALTVSSERFAMSSRARLSRDQRHSSLVLRVDGSREALRIQEFEITQGAGGLSVNGDIDLGAPLHWRLVATANALDPSVILHAWPGSLDFELRSTGQWPESGPRARFELPRLSGRLRGRPITGTGDVSLRPDRKPEGRIELRSGGASLVALASRGAQPRVDATLSIANLQDWRSDLQGAIDLEVVAKGRVPELQIDATLQARELRQGRNQIGQATLHLNGHNTRAPQGTAELTGTAVKLSGFEFDRATVTLEGAARAHTLALDAQGEQLTLRMQADGAYAKESWTGSVGRLALEAQNAPVLALLEPAPLSITPQGFALGRSCMKGGDIQVCAAARHQRRELAVEYSIEALPLDVLAAIFAPGSDVTIEGMLEGRGNLRRAANGTLGGRATLGSSSGAFVQGADKDALRLEYRDLGMDIDLDGGAARAHLRGELLKQGALRGSLSVAMTEADPSLHGSAGITLRDLEPLGWWVPQLANLKGSGEVSAELAGTLGAPRLAFTVKADGLDAEVPVLGLHLREGSVRAGLNPEGGFEAQGSISSGEGLLRLSGARDASRNLALRFSGSNLLAANIPGARVTIAPDLDLTGRLGELDLGGTVKIETAEVNLEKLSLSKSYRPSADVIVVDREVRVKDHAPGLRTDVRILFGDAVKLAGFGLDATVSGELQILEERGQPGRAHGEIRLAGTYEAFGRKLTIERGRLQFAGTSLDDPQLDILAARKIDDVTAKLQVTGTAQKPKLDVFTDPAMSQTDAMSYLLTGKPASDLHGEEGANVQSAAQSVGSVLGNRLAKRLGGKMGFIDEVGVEQNTDLGGSAFTVGKYLSPKLFVSYGVGLFEPGSATTLRYEFSDHWSMEANDTPDDSHAGVRYRIEK